VPRWQDPSMQQLGTLALKHRKNMGDLWENGTRNRLFI